MPKNVAVENVGIANDHGARGEGLTVAAPDRLDRALVPLAGSRAKAAEALKAGRVTLDGVPVGLGEAAREVAAGQRLALLTATGQTGRKALAARRVLEPHGLVILHEDRALIAVHKPAGLLSTAATFQQKKQEANAHDVVGEYLVARHGEGATCHVVHRIDRDTSGVLLFACTPEAETLLRDQFAAHTPERVYWAIVAGSPAPRGTDPRRAEVGGEWENWMRWDAETNRQLPTPPEAPEASLARAAWRWLGSTWNPDADAQPAAVSLLEVRLETGRRNQIRLQAALAGHPLVGERQYHPPRGAVRPTLPANLPATARQALHARSLTVTHPERGAPVTFTAPPPADFAKLLKYIGFHA